MADRMQLHAETREVIGKKVKRLRRVGILPATVYGHNVTPTSIQFRASDLRPILRGPGTTQLIDLVIDDQAARPVLLKNMDIDAKRNLVQHIEFFQANLREKIHMSVPVHLVNEAPAVRDGGILLTVQDHLLIESLPDNVPAEGIEVDVSGLAEINSQINAGDIPLPAGVVLLSPPDETVAKVDPPVAEEVVEAVLTEDTALPVELGGDETQADAVPES